MTGKILNKLNSETKNVNIGQSKLQALILSRNKLVDTDMKVLSTMLTKLRYCNCVDL